jgi:hypothetical protein
VYAEFITTVEAYRFALMEARHRKKKESTSDHETLPRIFDIVEISRQLVLANTMLELYGSDDMRNAAHKLREVMIDKKYLIEGSEESANKVYECAEMLGDIARQDLGIRNLH